MKNKMEMFFTSVKLKSVYVILMAGMFFTTSVSSQNGKEFGLFKNKIPKGTSWKSGDGFERKGGPGSDTASMYIYLQPSKSPATLTGFSIPIRENPGQGEYRYISYSWIKWGGTQIGIKFGHDESAKMDSRGLILDYTYYSGVGDSIKKGLRISDKITGNWVSVTRDLWKDFGNFTLTDVSFICPDSRDAGFYNVALGKSVDVFAGAPPIIPTKVVDAISVDEGDDITIGDDAIADGGENTNKADVKEAAADEEGATSDANGTVQVDWIKQIKAGGNWMYPLYVMALVAIIVALQRWITSRSGRLAPRKLRKAIRISLEAGDLNAALEACENSRSTLSECLKFIFKHHKAGREVVSQTAGDIAARDIRSHLAQIYPLSVCASLAPLLGLLGTIVGMIEAFNLVAVYGDEGGAAILSDSISKALITTALGLIIAAPSVAVYFLIKNKIMRLASRIEQEIEYVITKLYLSEESEKLKQVNIEEESYADTN